MSLYTPDNTPQQNLAILAADPYPGRLLVTGFIEGIAVQAYAICGRSDDSRNRLLVLEDNVVSTETFDKTKNVTQPELTIYDALRRNGSIHIVSNGDQTATVIQYLRSGRSFEEAMQARTYEHDAPNFTARISGFIDISATERQPRFGLSIIRKTPGSDQPIHKYYSESSPEIELTSGIGYGLQTYTGNTDPLPSFSEPPFRLPLQVSVKETAEMLWSHLNSETRLAVAVKTISPDGAVDFFLINAHL